MNRGQLHALVSLARPKVTSCLIETVVRSLAERPEGHPRFESVRIVLGSQAAHLAETVRDSLAQWASASDWKLETELSPVQATNLSLRVAARQRADLLVLDGTPAPEQPSLLALLRALERDPYYAFIQPRFAGFGSGLIRKLDPNLGDPEIASIPRAVIDSAPDIYLIPDRLSSVVLIRANVARDFWPLDESFETLRGALRELAARARRVGFRCAIANDALSTVPEANPDERDARQRDFATIVERYPEVADLNDRWRKLPLHEYEAMLGRAASFSPELSRTLLVELADLATHHNGTSEAILGLLSGFHACDSGWRITLLVSKEASAYHDLEARFPKFESVWPLPECRFTAVFRPVQPWSFASLSQLHRLGLFNFVMMFDTILNEIHQGSPVSLAEVWKLVARSADGIMYISDFTRQRFRSRFPIDASVEEYVPRLSLDPTDFCHSTTLQEEGDYLYVVGNSYPHKWMQQTVDDLIAAFPFQKIMTLGYDHPKIPQLTGLVSGDAPQSQVEALYANARAIIYPSQYEGFGFPIVQGLSYGKPVIARKSELLRELAAHYRGPGSLIEFDTDEELVEAVGRVIHHLPIDSLPLGEHLAPDQAPHSWTQVGAGIIEFIESCVCKPEASNWARRQQLISSIEAYVDEQHERGL